MIWTMRSTASSRNPRWRAAISSTSAPRGMPPAPQACSSRRPPGRRQACRAWSLPFLPLFYGLGGVFLGDLVVEEAGRIRRRHEAPVDLGIDADVLVDLAFRHLD